MPAHGDLEQRLHILRDADICVLLDDVVQNVRTAIEAREYNRANGMLAVWEDALGRGMPALVRQIDEVRGVAGYQRALAEFSRAQDFREKSLGSFRLAEDRRSRRGMDRWGWVANAYRASVQRFIDGRQLMLQNTVGIRRARAALRESPIKSYRILMVAVDAYAKPINQAATSPRLADHALGRVHRLLAESVKLQQQRELHLAERAALQKQAALMLAGVAHEAQISQLGSVAEQIRAYRRLICDEEIRVREQHVAVTTNGVRTELAQLWRSRGARTLAELASTLARRPPQPRPDPGDSSPPVGAVVPVEPVPVVDTTVVGHASSSGTLVDDGPAAGRNRSPAAQLAGMLEVRHLRLALLTLLEARRAQLNRIQELVPPQVLAKPSPLEPPHGHTDTRAITSPTPRRAAVAPPSPRPAAGAERPRSKLGRDPGGDPEVRRLLVHARSMGELGMHEEALEDYLQLSKMYPNDGLSYVRVAVALERLGRRGEARDAALRGMRTDAGCAAATVTALCLSERSDLLDQVQDLFREVAISGELDSHTLSALREMVARLRRRRGPGTQ